MNKLKKDWKNLKAQITLDIGPPSKCHACDYDVEKMKEDFGVAWLEHRIPNTNFVFYMCPNCCVCSGNKHSVENAKKIKAQGNDGKSRLFLPKKDLFTGQN